MQNECGKSVHTAFPQRVFPIKKRSSLEFRFFDGNFAGALTFADEGIRTFHAACALTLADLISTKSKVFLSFRTGHKRTGRGPLVNHPGQRRGGEDSSSPLDSTLPPRRAYLDDSAPLLNIVWSNGGWNKFHLAYRTLIYRGHLQFERLFLFRGSLATDCASVHVRLFSFAEVKVLCVCVRAGLNTYPLHLH